MYTTKEYKNRSGKMGNSLAKCIQSRTLYKMLNFPGILPSCNKLSRFTSTPPPTHLNLIKQQPRAITPVDVLPKLAHRHQHNPLPEPPRRAVTIAKLYSATHYMSPTRDAISVIVWSETCRWKRLRYSPLVAQLSRTDLPAWRVTLGWFIDIG